MKTELNTFFSTTVPSALKELQEDTKSHWGNMTAQQMLTHLLQSSKMIHLENPKLIIKEKYIEKAIAFLYTEKPLAKGI